MGMEIVKGDKVIFSRLFNGSPSEVGIAREHLEIGYVYTVREVVVRGWDTHLKFEEVPNWDFKADMFGLFHREYDNTPTKVEEDVAE